MNAQKKETKRDWVSLLIVPIILLFLGWWYTNRTEERAYQREMKQTRLESLTFLLEHIWMNKIYIEEIVITNELIDVDNKQSYLAARRLLNESYSKLYVDMLKLQVLFDNEIAKNLSTEIRKYIGYGADIKEVEEYAKTNSGNIEESASEIQFMVLELLKYSTNSKYINSDHW